MSDKINRNKKWCESYRARGQDKKNAKRKHITLANYLEKKMSRMNMRGMDTSGIIKQIQHHRSLSAQ